MGIRGLTTFLEQKNPHTVIDVLRQIRFWKRDDEKPPIIAIDSVALFYSLFNAKDLICGGRLGEVFDNFENLLKKLKEIGAILVFFSRLNAHKFSREWMSRCRQRFLINIKMYDQIRSGRSLHEIATFIEDQEVKNTPPALSELYAIASKYGEYRFVTNNLYSEMASFAMRDEARAIISDNSEFFIFEGDFKFWSAKHFKFDPRNQNKIKTAQFDRSGIAKVIGIDPIHRPLFATLMGNEHGEGFRDELKKFQKSLGMGRFKKVAQYAKNAKKTKDGTLDFGRISSEVFDVCDDKHIRFLKRSVNSYKLNAPEKNSEKKRNKFKLQLSTTIYNRDILMSLNNHRVIILGFYDLRGRMGMETLPVLFMKWDQRKSGILNEVCNKNISGYVFAKFKLSEGFESKSSESIKPNFTVPEMTNMYFTNEASDIKWDMIAFIMEFDDVVLTTIKSLPREFRLVCTTLLILRKGGFYTEDEADGVLLTMHMIETDESTVRNTQYCGNLTEDYIRAAHIFNNTVDQVRQNFAITGLLSEIQPSRFDGAYFQHVMSLTEAERKKMMTSCTSFRIYI